MSIIKIDQSKLPTLDDLKTQMCVQIDKEAELERSKHITTGDGQAMTYMQKANEAAKYLAATSPVASDYPLLSAEVGITAATLDVVAQIVNEAYSQWQLVGAAIEAVRLGTKKAINEATTLAAAQAIFNAVAWPEPPTE